MEKRKNKQEKQEKQAKQAKPKKHRFEKTMRIVNELMLTCYQLGATECHLDVDLQPKIATYRIRAPIENVDPEVVREMEDQLNQERQPNIEQMYWMLGGQSENHGSMMLVGMMVNEAKVVYENGELNVTVLRYR